MKRNLVIFMLLIGALLAYSADVTITAPSISANTVDATFNNNVNSTINPMIDALATNMQKELKTQFENFETPLFAAGVANAGVFSSSVAQILAVQDFKLLQVGAGFTVAMQAPSSNPADVDAIAAALQSGGDVLAGIGAQAGAQASLNLGFLVPNLAVGIRAGALDFSKIATSMGDSLPEGFSGKTAVFGVIANYRLIKPFNAFVFQWNGVNVGSGLIYQSLDVSYSPSLAPITQSNSISSDLDSDSTPDSGTITLTATPSLSLRISSSTLMIPLEVSTGVRLLIFNVSAGMGADLAMGGGKINIDAESGLALSGSIYSSAADSSYQIPSTELSVNDGSVSIKAGTTAKPTFFNFKVFASPAIVLPFVALEVPLTYYINDGSGFSAGITLSLSL
ncbi:hypothetical protein WKV44_09300 [Spirochaetia bacterium 38H-sp]|uniref:Uncharacterized protein n=1 Tax=Rarispira pelagica TaxID=3141764 RepID=A0ABU9UEZ7_9SPIR